MAPDVDFVSMWWLKSLNEIFIGQYCDCDPE